MRLLKEAGSVIRRFRFWRNGVHVEDVFENKGRSEAYHQNGEHGPENQGAEGAVFPEMYIVP